MFIKKKIENPSSNINVSQVRLEYRPDIDGLRAVAVLSVVIFHAFPSLLKGGFVGVDVFFVISGYLITSIIHNSLERGTFSFLVFYGRRIRRIFPSLIVVLLFCYLLSWVILFADEFMQLGLHIAAGAGFVSNLVLWSESGYFDTSADTKPLLHLWSLGVEEQFYIVWPMLLWVSAKHKIKPPLIITIIFSISLGLNLSTVYVDGAAAFYSPQTRFWELLAGALLAYLSINSNSTVVGGYNNLCLRLRRSLRWDLPEIKDATFCNVLSFAGILLIVTSLFGVSKDVFFPGLWAVMPVAGAACIIAAGPSALFNKFFLSNRIVVLVGLISFPLYLWHWPILAFIRIVDGDSPRLVRIAAISLSVALAWFTYKFVEYSFRFGSKENRKTIFLIFMMILIGSIGYYTFRCEGFKFRYNFQQVKALHPLSTKMQNSNYENSKIFAAVWKNVPLLKSRDFLLYSEKIKEGAHIAILGDSHANRLYLGVENEARVPVLNIGRGTCPPFIDVDVIDKTEKSFLCQPLVNNYLKYVKETKEIDTVILNAFYAQYNRDVMLSSDGKVIQFQDALVNTIEYLLDSSKTVIIVLDVPEVPSMCYSGKGMRSLPVWKNEHSGPCTVSKSVQDDMKNKVVTSLSRIEYGQGRVFLFDPATVLCKNEICGEIDEKNYLYNSDGNHLNAKGVHLVGGWLLEELQQVTNVR